MSPPRDEPVELDLLLDTIHQRQGQDFRNYSRTSLTRRIDQVMREEGLANLSQLQERVRIDTSCMTRLVDRMSVRVTAMFRDPAMHALLRREVVPWLRTLPSLRIWHAGCATGEEVHSVAILLHEEGLLDRARIHATDVSETALGVARSGLLPMSSMREYTRNYLEAGGRADFSDYYTARYGHAIISRFLGERVTFSRHDLAVDPSPGQFHLVMCRNVTMFFNERLQAHVHGLLAESLAPQGFLVLGRHETIRPALHSTLQDVISRSERVYRKVR